MPLTSLLLALAPTVPPPAQGCGCWENVQTADFSAPLGRHECGAVTYQGDFLLLGGRGFRTVDRYDPIANVWTLGNFAPLEIHHFQPVVVGDEVWIAGAFTGPFPNETPVPEIRVYDPATDTWSLGPTIPAARRRGSAACVLHEGDLYLVGGNTQGHDGGYVPWFDRYDPDTDTWTVLPDAPHARDHFQAFVIGNKLYAAAGRRTELPQPQANTVALVDVYDFSTGAWSTLPEPIPTERAGAVAVATGRHLIVVGGESPTQAHDEVEALDVLARRWSRLPDLIQRRHGAGGVVLGDELHVAAGVPQLGGSPELRTHERLVLTGVLAPSTANLVGNATFDVDVGGWSGPAVHAAEGSIAPGSLEVSGGLATRVESAEEQVTYTLHAVHRRPAAAGSAALRLVALDAGGVALDQTEASLAVAADWTTVELELTTPPGAVDLRLELEALGGATAQLDDLGLVEKPTEIPRVGIPANPFVLRPTGAGAVLGQTWQPSIDHTDFAPAAVFDALVLSALPTELPFVGGQLLVDLGPALSFSASPGAAFALPIPNDPSLIGRVLHAQGAAVEVTGLSLSNALELTLSKP